MATALNSPTTKEQALTTAYLANDFEIQTPRIDIKLDDSAIAFTVRLQVAGGDQIEFLVSAGNGFYEDFRPGTKVLLNIKAASGTPNAQIFVA